jgi:hypothetical protein
MNLVTLKKQKGNLNVAVTSAATEVCTWSVPGCKIAFAHELMENYFESKRVRKANENIARC